MERSLLSSNHPEKQFDVKLPMAGKVFALVCLFALSTQFAVAQNKIAVNALPTGGKVVAGAATISSTSTATSATMNINQTSQRAVINWQTFNVGKNATVNFNQPNSSAVTLNRVVSATPSMIQGAINANGQVILVNPNGVTFGKGAEVNAAGVVASTLNISNQDFMNGKNIYSGNGEGKIVNKGTITATDPNGYIALLAPEIRNQGYLIARMGPSSTVALASGEKISLDFRGTQLIGVSIDKAAYKALIENKRIIETNGGLIIVAAGTARELMSSVIQNTGRISANSIVDNGGVIELVADNVTNSGSISANGGTNGVGGQVNIVGNNITLAANSQTTATGNLGGGSIQVGVGKTVATNTTPASAVNGNANTAAAPQTAAQILASNTQGVGTQAQTVSVEQGAVVDASAINSGNGGAIVIWSQVKTTVNGILKAVGGYLNGNGGLIETSSAGLVSLGKSLSIDTSSSKGSAGLWYVDPIDLTIDGASSAVISAALVNNNVSITVAGNTCPSLGSCTQNGSGNLTIVSGADIIKQSGSLTTLTLTASGVFNLNANISGQNLDVIINSSIAYLNAGSTITANQVTVQAQTIYSYGNINSGSLSNLGSAIQLLGSALYISGNLTVGANLANSSNSTSSNSNTVSYNGTLIRQEDLPTYLAAANQTTLNLDQVYATTAANQANFTTAVNNQITLTGTESISIAATAQLLANGTTGGVIMATAPQINLVRTSNSSPSSGSQSIQGNGSLIQANGNNGPGGTISFTAANDFNINVATISASGSTDGGSIRLISSGGNLLMANSLIQTNGGTGRGGSLGVSGANSTTINSSTLEATGFSKGGSIMVGYDSAGKTLPYSESTTIDAATILNANQTDSTNTTGGGLIETSGGTLTQLASINAGRGGMWLLDPYDYVINTVEAMSISNLLNGGTNVSISTLSPSINLNGQVVNGLTGAGVIYIYSAITATQNTATLTFTATTIYLGANITTRGAQTYNGNVVVLGEIQLYTIGSSGYNGDYTPDSTNLTITGTVSGGYAANALISLTGNGGYFNQSTGYVGVLSAGGSTSLAGGILAYVGQDGSGLESQYTWTPTYTSIGTALVVGAGGGGGAYGGAGGSGGGVVGQNLLPQLAAGTAYTIYVGNGGTGGNFVTTNGAAGGYSSISGGQLGSMLASGGSGGVAGSTNGGSGAAGNASANNGGNGVQVSVVNSTVSGSQGQFVSTSLYFGGGASSFNGTTYYYGGGGGGAGGASTDTAPTYYGYGGIASTRRDGLNYTPQGCIACDRNGNPGQPNTGMGGGGGVYSGSYIGLGGNGANGVVMIHAVSNPVSSLSIEVFQNSVSLTGVSGSGIGTSNLSGLNINAGPLGTNKSAIQGVIQGQLNLSFTSDATWGTPGAAASALVLSGANTFTGSTTINNGGTLVVANHATLGDPNNNLTLNGTGILDLQYSVSVGNFVMGGTNSITNSAGNSAFQVLGTATLGGSIITSGTQNYYGPVTLIADTTLSTNNRNASGAAINFNGPVNTDPTQILPSSLTTTTVNSFTTFSGAVGALNPIGNLTVNGSSVISANINTQGTQTYKGNVIIGGAKVFLDSTQLDQNFGQAISINGNLDGAGGGATNNLSILSGQAAMTITGNIGSSNPLASLSLGQINTNGYTYAGQPGGINISGSVNAGATLIINSSYYDNRITGVISGATSVVASGGGGLTLSAVNTYTGSTTIKGDTFFLTADSNLGAAPSTPVIGDLVLDGGYLTVNTSSSFALSPNRWVSIIGSGTIQPGQGATLTIGGNIAGPGVLTKGGYGTLVLGGNNYQLNGNIFVTFGTLQAASAAAFGASGNTVSSAANTTIDLAGASQTASYIFNLNGGVLTNSNGSISAALASGSVIKTSDSVSILSFSGPGILDLSNTVLDDGNRGAAFGGGANVIATNPQNSVAYIASDMANSINLTSSTNLTTSSLVGYSGITRAGTVTLTSSGYITVNTPISSYGNVSLTSNLFSSGSNALTVNAGITSANQNISLNAPYGSISISSALSAGNGSVSIVGGFSNSLSQGNTAIYDTSYITALTISATGTGDPAYVTLGNLNATGSMGNGITVSSKGNITVGSITNTGSAGIKIMAGSGMAAGDISSGGSITSLGPINNSGGEVALSTAAPSVNAGSAGTIEAAIGISPSTASIATNISYGIAGGTLVHPGAYLGNYIDYRQTASVAYSVTLASNYSAVYGTAYNSSSANAWLLANASVGLTGTGFGYSTSAAGANLRFSSRVNGVADSNVVQTASTITSSSLYSTDGSVITLSGPSRTYTITPAPLGISVNGVYSGANVITPTSFTTYGLVNGDTIGGLSTATLAFKDVNSVNNYVTAISIGTGSAILSNYQLNPLGRNIATNSALMNSVTLTPIALTVSGAVAANKTYDGTTVATLSASGLNGVLAQDTANVALTLSSGSFANKNVGTNITVTAAGSISGSAVAAGDYTLIQPTVTANISPAPLGVSISGTYTGSTLINNPNIGIAGLVNNETLTSISQAVMSSPNVSANGSNYVVSFTIGAGTASLSNYVINSGYYATPGYTNNMVTLTPKTLTTSGSSAYSKTYDGTNIASINPGTLVGVINSDDVSILSNAGTFASSNAANNVVVTPNLVLGGTASSNYSLTQPTGLTANISKAPLGISIAATYNGSTTVTPTILGVNGLVNGETLSSITSAVISNANVANTLTTYATSITIGSGTASMSNYMLGSTRNNSTSSNSENIVTITPKALSLSAVKVYDGATTLSGSQITMTGLIGTQTLNYTGANINDANVATPNKYISSITLTDGANGGLASNYLAPTLTSAYTYNNATVNQKAVALSATKVYDANNTLTGGQVTINTGVSGETLTYSGATVNDINVATAGKYINAITLGNAVSGNGVASNYLLPTLNSTNAPVTITKASLTVTANAAAMTYGASVLPSFSATITGFVGSDTSSAVTGTASFSTNATPYNGQAGSGSSVGTYSITPALGSLASGNYSFGVFSQGSLVVNKGNLTITASNDSKVYGASSTTAGVNYTAGGTAINSTAGYTTSGLVNGDTITAVTLTSTGGAVPTNVGTYTITPSALVGGTNVTNSNYTISYINASTGLAVNPKVVTLAATKTYDATNALNTVVISGLIGSQTLTYSGATTNDVNVATTGKYLNAITLGNATDGSGGLAVNYALPSLTVASANNAVTITAKVVGLSASKTYDATTTLTGAQVVITTGVGSQTLSYTGATANDANVATANKYISAITLANATDSSGGLASNYALPTLNNANAALTITPKALSLSAVKVYDGATTLSGSQITMTGLIGTQTLNYTGANINDANVATPNKYISSITLTDGANGGLASNYLAPTLTSAYTYNNATVNQKAVALSATKVYDANNTLTGGQVTINTGVSGETLTYSGATVNDINVATAGKYINAITLGNAVSGNGVASNYLLPTLNSTNAPVTITKASLTVTANAAAMTYGASVLPSFSATITGFVGSDTSSAVTGTASFSTNATPYNGQAGSGSSVGTYSITPALGSLASGNYSFGVFSQGSLVVNKGNLTITASNDSKVYGASSTTAGVNYTAGGTAINSTAGYTTSGLVNGDTITAVTLTSTGGAVPTNVGTYTITPSALVGGTNVTNSNYTISYINASTGLAVNPKVVTLAATKTYDATNALNTVVISGLIGSQTLTYSGATTNDVNVATTGKYLNAITLGNATDGSGGLAVNYALPSLTVASANNAVTITAKVVGLSASKTYDATTTLTGAQVVITTGVGSQTLSYTGATANDANVATANKYISAITLANATDSSGGLASNYALPTLNNANAAVVISPKVVGLSAAKIYDATTALTGNQVTITTGINGQSLSYTGATANDSNVVTAGKVISAITLVNGTGGIASNYALPTLDAINAPVTITPKTVTLSAIKTYDSTTTLFAGQVTINTGITGEALTYSAGTINNANVSANGSNFITALTLNSLTGTASNYALPTLNSTNAPVTVNPAPLTVTGSVSPDKTYDGTTVTTVSNGQLQGLINNQTLTLSQAGAFASANAGTAINVVVNDSIANGTGTNAGIASNYSLTQPTDVVANITPKNLTVTGSATSNKVYDGTFTATITGGQLVGVVAADIANVVLTQTGTFTAANVGNAIAITANDSLSGTQAGNYSLTQPTVAAANITPKTLSLSATKTYDSTTSLLGAVTILTGVGTETLGYTAATASDANVVTTGKYITAITLVNGSGLASNYVLPVLNVANAPVTINPVTALVVVGATAQGKTYDGTTSVTLSNTGTLQGLIGSQTLTLTEAGAFATANAGSAVNVVMNDSISNGTNGGLASNYSLTQPTYVTAPIAKAPLGVTVTGTYTASTTIAPSTFTTNGLVNNETITALSSATVNDANVMTANNYVKSIVIGAGTANVNNYAIGPNYNNLAGNTQNIATITPKVITVSGTQVANKEYNATTTANLTGGTLVGVINSDSANVNLVQAGNFASANIGNPVAVTASDTITGSAASNYSLTQPTGLSAIITSKALTITIAAETKIYGDGIAKTSNSVDGTNTSSQSVNYTNGVATNSFQGFSVSGLVTGSNDAVNTVTLTSAGGALTAGVASGAAAYAITGSGAVGVNLGNYAINYVSNNYSVMTVTPRPLNVTVANASMAYGATALPNFTSTITGLVNGDQASAVLSTTATPYNGQAGSASNIGSYAITAAAVSNANYSVISTNGTLTVNPVTLVLQANTQGGTGSPIVYGTPTVLNQNASVALTAASLAGLTNGDYINTVSVTFNGSQTISGATAAGTYTGALVASGASGTGLSNYSISYQPGNLIISKAVLTVTAANDARFTSQTEATGTYNGVVFSGFKNADTVSNLDMSGLVINRVNTTTPNTPVSNNVGNYAGSLAPSGIATSSCNTCLPNGNAQNGSPSLNGNYTFNYVNGNYSILGAGQILVKYAPVTMNYGSVTNANINYGTPVVSYMAAGSNLVSSSDGLGTVTVNPTIANLQNSTAGYLNTGSYSLNPTATVTSSTTNLSNLAVTIVGGITVMPKVLSFANLGISGVSKVYDGLTTMTGLSLNVGTGVFLAQGPTTDNVTVVANGAFTDKNVGTAKSYTVGVSFGGADANNYVISGGGVYTADGITNPANGTITQLSSVTYIGAATGGAWSDPNSWQVTNGTTKGAIPDASMVNGVATNNVANIIVPVGNTVVYDAGVSNAAPITSNLANAGNVSFGSALASNATFNVAMTISGAGSVTIAGPGTLTLSGANTYTGNTIISNGSTLSVTAANSIGAGNIQGSGGSLRVANGISLAQINATGTLRLLSDVVTSGNQAWGNLTVTQSPLTTLTSTNGNITFNGLLDGASSKANSLLVLAPNGNVTFNNSVGSVMPLNVLEVDASRININADVLTSDQQNYCGMAGCYSQLSSAQVSANYCATTGNNCYSKNTSTLAFNLLASGTGTTGDYVLNTDIQVNPAPTAQVYIGDNGAVGFLYNTYGTYATKAFGSTPPLFQNNAVFARTLISKDPMVTFGGAINDASAASTHTLQAAAIKVSNASSPNIQFGGSIGNTNPLYSINALTQFIDAANSMNGSIKFAANTTITSISNMSYGSNSFTPTGVTFQTVSPSASINFVVPAGSPFSLAGGQIKSNYVNYNGAATRTLGGITAQVSLSGGIVTPRAAAPVSAPSTRNSFILAAVAEQTKIERKYDVDASVDVGEIETDDGPAAADDQDDKKKKKAGNQKAAQ
ncbi:filamentous hemagglutinin N-terminal domain-containing protein [Polynucleobacter paneuropaeus]|nr:filamentous hemagglutinin N-terminal domain-containing protein [Polynucleobacter paneuropaeus]